MLTIARQQNTEKEEAAVFLSPKILSQIERTNVEVKIENLFLSTKNNFKKSPGGSGWNGKQIEGLFFFKGPAPVLAKRTTLFPATK